MPSSSFQVTTKASPQDVFAYVGEIRNCPEWIDAIERAELVAGEPLSAGARYHVFVKRLLASDAMVDYEVLEAEAPRLLRCRVESPQFQGTETMEIAPDGDGAKVSYENDYSLKGAHKLVQPLAALLESATMPGTGKALRERLDAL